MLENKSIDDYLDSIDEVLDKSWDVPLTGGRSSMVNVEKIRQLVDGIRMNMPTEIRQAQRIVADRTEIINSAKQEAENIIRKAEERAKYLVSQEEIYKEALKTAEEIVNDANFKAREVRHSAIGFADGVLKRAEDQLTSSLTEIKQSRQSLRVGNK